jgi:PAS domain S-box-containing protein
MNETNAMYEDQRLEALGRYGVLDTPPEAAFDDLTRLATQVCSVPIAAISFVDRDRVWFKSRIGLGYESTQREGSFCAVAIENREMLVAPDVLEDPVFAQHPAVTGEPHLRFYCGFPLESPDGYFVGVLCVMDIQPRNLFPYQLDALRTLGHQVMIHLELRRSVTALAETAHEYHDALERLETSEAFYHSLVESLPQHIFRKDIHEQFTFANQRFCQMLGKTLDEIIGKTDFDFFPPEMASKFQLDDRRVMETAEPLDTIEANRTNDGGLIFAHVIKTPLINPITHRIEGIQGIFWDVTERKRIEEALAFERDLLRGLLDNIPDRIYFKDLDSRFIRVSSALAKRLGLASPEHVVGKTDFDFHPTQQAQEFFQDEQRILLTGQPLINKLERQTDVHGHEVWAMVTKVPIYNPGGGVRGLIGISHDVTQLMKAEQALRRAEEKYRTIFERAVEGIFQTTPDGHYLSANPALARMYGYANVEEMTAALTDIGHQLYVDAGRREEFIRLMRENGTVSSFESQVFRHDGGVIWISENARAAQDDKGNILYFEGTVEEITDRKQAEFERERARLAALESARLKSEFLANVSHEIRTPMNGIIGMTTLLLETALNNEQKDYADTIRTSANALLDIINELLDFSKIEAGKLELEKVQFNLRDSVEATVDLLAERVNQKNLDLVWWVEREVPETIRNDQGRVRQVLLNLIGNAIKFTEKGEVYIHVSRRATEDESRMLLFEVVDTGIGIKPEAIVKIFHSFTQADGSTTRRYGGTGLGLSISKQLVELMGGSIGVNSSPGCGSTFWFTLPFEAADDDGDAMSVPAAAEVLKAVRVLVVDDHPTTRDVLAKLMGSWRMEVAGVANAAEALDHLSIEHAEGRTYSFIIVDMLLGDATGLALARMIKAEGLAGEARLVLLAPLGKHIDPEVMHGASVAASLIKPVKPSRLLECLSTLATGKVETWHGTIGGDQLLPDGLNRNAHVLVAEDNLVNQKVALRQLNKLGLQADAVANGREVLDALERVPYDVVLMDCHMPDMDGYSASQEIQMRLKDPGDLPPLKSKPYIIALTANALEGDRERCLAAGMDDYLCKPLETAELLAALGRAGVSMRTLPLPPAPAAAPLSSASVLDQNVLDKLRGLRQPGEPDPVVELIDLFLEDMPKHTRKMEEALKREDAAGLKSAAHSLKGSSRNMGALRLGQLCADLETQAKEGNLTQAPQLFADIQAEFAEVQKALESERSKKVEP